MSIAIFKKYILSSVVASAALSLSAQAADKIEMLDVMVLYTSDIQNSDSDYRKDPDARFSYLEDYTNQTLKNSDVSMQIRIVHTEPVPEKYNRLLTESVMDSIERNDAIAAIRKKHGADFVVVIGRLQGNYCGLANMIKGNPKTGRLYSNAREKAFSYNDYVCSGTTFAHELGHNMALDHSVKQGDKGGVWPWGVGHGKVGKWVTTMAYNDVYNAPKYVQFFSNPRLNKCDGDSCGIYNKADASKNLNLLASQFADFMPTVHGSKTSSSGGSTSSSGGSTSTNNPLSNDFNNGLQGWKDGFGAVVKYEARGGVDATGGMSISKRNKQHQGARKDLKGLLNSNTTYTLEADIFVDGKKREKFKSYLYRKIAGKNKVWIKIGSRTISPGSWQKVKMTMRVPDVADADILDLFFWGPKKGVDIRFDNIRITKN